MNIKNLIGVALIAGVLFCCGSEEPVPNTPDSSISDQPPTDTQVVGTGTFESYAHSLAGKAILYSKENGDKIVRLEDFTMTAGPDVYVFLSKTNNYSQANVLEVARLTTGFNMSEVNFDFQSPSYNADYKFVLVYCVQYSSLFGYTELK